MVRRDDDRDGEEQRVILLPSSVQVHVAIEPMNLHKSFEGLSNAL
jgi:hypothetical protein